MEHINILIVEDETAAIDRLKRHLIKFGYENIYSCQSKNEALQLCKLVRFDLSIIDINLTQQHKDGIALAELINSYYNTPIIYLTGLSDTDTLQKVRNTSYSEYIVKPFSPQQLFASITLVLLKHPGFVSEDQKENTFYTKEEIWLLHNRHYVKIEFATILYIEAEDKIIKIYTTTQCYPYSTTLASFERQVNAKSFVRISRKSIVNLDRVNSFDLKDHQLSILLKDKLRWLAVGPQYRENTYANFHKLKTT